jgi:hypothetical protein
MEHRETPRMKKYGERKRNRIMMATVCHVTAWAVRTKFKDAWFLLNRRYDTEHLSKLNNLHITRCGFEPVSFRIPASHYFRYVCPQCVIQVQSFLNLLSAVFTSDQPTLQSAIIWNLYHTILQISWYEGLLISPYPDILPDVVGRNR